MAVYFVPGWHLFWGAGLTWGDRTQLNLPFPEGILREQTSEVGEPSTLLPSRRHTQRWEAQPAISFLTSHPWGLPPSHLSGRPASPLRDPNLAPTGGLPEDFLNSLRRPRMKLKVMTGTRTTSLLKKCLRPGGKEEAFNCRCKEARSHATACPSGAQSQPASAPLGLAQPQHS